MNGTTSSVVPEMALDVFSQEDGQQLHKLLYQTETPTVFLRPSEDLSISARTVLKVLYDYLVKNGGRQEMNGLKQLYPNPEFDPEQIWFQLEHQIEYCQKRIKKLINRMEKKQSNNIQLLDPELNEALDELLDPEKNQQNKTQNGQDDYQESDSDVDTDVENNVNKEGEETEGEEDQNDDEEEQLRESKRPKLEFEDDFMNVEDMDKFLEQAEQAHERAEEGIEDELEKALNEEIMKYGNQNNNRNQTEDQDEEGIDADDMAAFDNDIDDVEGDEVDNIFHEDFFGPRKVRNFNLDQFGVEKDKDYEYENKNEQQFQQLNGEKRVRFTLEGDENGIEKEDVLSEDDDEQVSPHANLQEQQQFQINKQIKQLEKEALGEKDWFMKGEVMAHQRPKDSVFEVDLDYDRTRKPPPEPTEDSGVGLEDTIKKRIAEGRFDDVIRIVPMPPKKEKKEIVLDDTQNQEGLASLYEQDFVRTATGNVTTDKQAPLREEIRQLFSKISYKLDALSHYSFAPMPVVEELDVKVDVPAIAMEEVGANAVAGDVSMKLPTEIYKAQTKDGELKADTELTKEDRKRRRRQQKNAYQTKQKKEREEKGQLPKQLGGWAMLAGRKSVVQQAIQKKEKTKYNSSQVFKQLEKEKEFKQQQKAQKQK
eukprot:TRINITY_DN2499_c0_g2_i1.p2 TRINITY_DN2499_c0_g2~~TRINITY_DN2499_c0_g2_i1.p2  ORF type:complete len:702 (+),score=148.79 TRINITY_DN2499_c0_g2_i1:155-2107(+)